MSTAVTKKKETMKYLKRKKKSDIEASAPERITNDTVAEHREKILAGGRKYKYPRQYQKHRLVIVSIAVVIVALILLSVVSWHQLYVAQNTSGILYRATQIVPVAVASVNGEPVRYSDYLMRYRSSLYYYRQYNSLNENTADGKRQAEYTKRQELTSSERFAFARQLAREKKIRVSDKDVDALIEADIQAQGVSMPAYERTVLRSYFNWSLGEYRQVVRDRITLKEVSFIVDSDAKSRITTLRRSAASGADFATLVKEQSDDDEATKSNGGDVGVMPLDNVDADGLIAAAANMEPNKVSDIIRGTDAYYIIKLISKTPDTVHYYRIRVALTEFEDRFKKLQSDGKIKEYIHIDVTETERR